MNLTISDVGGCDIRDHDRDWPAWCRILRGDGQKRFRPNDKTAIHRRRTCQRANDHLKQKYKVRIE